MPGAMRRPLGLPLLASLVVLASLLRPTGASASTVDQLRQQQRTVQQRRAAAAARLNVQRASVRQVNQALDALEANLNRQRSAVSAARQRAAAARARAAEAKAAEERTTRELDGLRARVRKLAVDEFIDGSAAVDSAPGTDSPMDAARRESLFDAAVSRSQDVADELRAKQQDLQAERAAAEAALASANAEERSLADRLADVDNAARQQRALADQAERRLEAQLAEADSLAAVDQRLANQIRSSQASLARRVGRAGGTGGRVTRRSGNISLTTVRGITVASSIADNLDRMLGAAEADGVHLSGNGYRDSSQQVATRRRNCGSSDYAVYEKPASQCHPPTARPGQSMHERGLAIDFTGGGGTIRRGSAGYNWLRAHAAAYGFHNLPSESWHWSTTGD
jgi:hypothetical protein